MPKSNEILENNFRFDGGIYSKEYKIIKDLLNCIKVVILIYLIGIMQTEVKIYK